MAVSAGPSTRATWYTAGVMALHCVHCDLTFEPEAGATRPRCPKCMRTSDLKDVGQGSSSAASEAGVEGGAARRYALLALVGLVAIGGYVVMRSQGGESNAEAGLREDDVAEVLSKNGVDREALQWVVPGDEVAAFAQKAAGDASNDGDKFRAVVDAIRARAKAGAFVPWSLEETLAREVWRPTETLAKLAEDGARHQLYPVEIVSLSVASLRSLEVPVTAVELTAWPDERAPMDPSGVIGYYGLSLDGELTDVFAGRTVPTRVASKPLTDAELVAAGLALEAVGLASLSGETKRSTRLAEAALALSPRSPTVRSARAAVWAASAALEQALSEFDAAAQLRRDAPRRYLQASASLLTGDVDRAQTQLNQLLTEAPDYALARVSVAALAMRHGDVPEAERQLDLAAQVSPDTSAVLWARAELKGSQGDLAAAKQLATRAFEARKTLDAYLRYAQLLRQLGDLSGAAETAAVALANVEASRRPALRDTLRALLGPAVMMEVEASEADADSQSDMPSSGPTDGLPSFDLGEPMKLEPSAGGALSTGDADGPILMMGDTSKLKLRDQSQPGLKLDLSH